MRKKSILSAIALVVLNAVAVSAQSVDEVVNKYIATVSGGSGFENINSMKMVMTGELGSMGNMSNMMKGQEMQYTMYTLKPDKFRMEMKVGPINMVIGNNCSDSWMSMMGRTMDLPGQNGEGFKNMMSIYDGNIIASFLITLSCDGRHI